MLRGRAVGADRSPPAAGRQGPHPGVRPARREGSEGERRPPTHLTAPCGRYGYSSDGQLMDHGAGHG